MAAPKTATTTATAEKLKDLEESRRIFCRSQDYHRQSLLLLDLTSSLSAAAWSRPCRCCAEWLQPDKESAASRAKLCDTEQYDQHLYSPPLTMPDNIYRCDDRPGVLQGAPTNRAAGSGYDACSLNSSQNLNPQQASPSLLERATGAHSETPILPSRLPSSSSSSAVTPVPADEADALLRKSAAALRSFRPSTTTASAAFLQSRAAQLARHHRPRRRLPIVTDYRTLATVLTARLATGAPSPDTKLTLTNQDPELTLTNRDPELTLTNQGPFACAAGAPQTRRLSSPGTYSISEYLSPAVVATSSSNSSQWPSTRELRPFLFPSSLSAVSGRLSRKVTRSSEQISSSKVGKPNPIQAPSLSNAPDGSASSPTAFSASSVSVAGTPPPDRGRPGKYAHSKAVGKSVQRLGKLSGSHHCCCEQQSVGTALVETVCGTCRSGPPPDDTQGLAGLGELQVFEINPDATQSRISRNDCRSTPASVGSSAVWQVHFDTLLRTFESLLVVLSRNGQENDAAVATADGPCGRKLERNSTDRVPGTTTKPDTSEAASESSEKPTTVPARANTLPSRLHCRQPPLLLLGSALLCANLWWRLSCLAAQELFCMFVRPCPKCLCTTQQCPSRFLRGCGKPAAYSGLTHKQVEGVRANVVEPAEYKQPAARKLLPEPYSALHTALTPEVEPQQPVNSQGRSSNEMMSCQLSCLFSLMKHLEVQLEETLDPAATSMWCSHEPPLINVLPTSSSANTGSGNETDIRSLPLQDDFEAENSSMALFCLVGDFNWVPNYSPGTDLRVQAALQRENSPVFHCQQCWLLLQLSSLAPEEHSQPRHTMVYTLRGSHSGTQASTTTTTTTTTTTASGAPIAATSWGPDSCKRKHYSY